MAVIITCGAFLGDYLDQLNNSNILYTTIFSLSSVFLSLYYILKAITQQNGRK